MLGNGGCGLQSRKMTSSYVVYGILPGARASPSMYNLTARVNSKRASPLLRVAPTDPRPSVAFVYDPAREPASIESGVSES